MDVDVHHNVMSHTTASPSPSSSSPKKRPRRDEEENHVNDGSASVVLLGVVDNGGADTATGCPPSTPPPSSSPTITATATATSSRSDDCRRQRREGDSRNETGTNTGGEGRQRHPRGAGKRRTTKATTVGGLSELFRSVRREEEEEEEKGDGRSNVGPSYYGRNDDDGDRNNPTTIRRRDDPRDRRNNREFGPRATSTKEQPFYTLRMEHRTGDGLATTMKTTATTSTAAAQQQRQRRQHATTIDDDGGQQEEAEERFLLFRSDKLGAVGKLILSVSAAVDPDADLPTAESAATTTTTTETRAAAAAAAAASPSSFVTTPAAAAATTIGEEDDEDDGDARGRIPTTTTRTDHRPTRIVRVEVHVLEVKEPYRGFDLGGLLFTQAMNSLQRRYLSHHESRDVCDHLSYRNVVGASSSSSSLTIQCRLSAEEDTARHSRLVRFYRGLGWAVRGDAPIRYVNNNDGETYRTVPMEYAETRRCVRGAAPSSDRSIWLRGKNRTFEFVPVRILGPSGTAVRPPAGTSCPSEAWILLETGEGLAELRSTRDRCGYRGCRSSSAVEDSSETSSLGFQGPVPTIRHTRTCYKIRIHRIIDRHNLEDGICLPKDFCDAQRELWVFEAVDPKYRNCSDRSANYLAVDRQRNILYQSRYPTYWEVGRRPYNRLRCTDYSPALRRHYRLFWSTQTFQYAQRMSERYLLFNKKRMSLHEALEIAGEIPANRLLPKVVASGEQEVTYAMHDTDPTLKSLCFHTAELFRASGYPDWVQLTALVYFLGQIAIAIDTEHSNNTEDQLDWTIPCQSRVVGCPVPVASSLLFREYQNLNADEDDRRYSSTSSRRFGIYDCHCGLENVFMAWTGPEYVYHLLKHNQIQLPDDGLYMIRFAALEDWLNGEDSYKKITGADDDVSKPIVQEFRHLVQLAETNISRADMYLSSDDCEKLWLDHYGNVAIKYGADGCLMW